MSVTPDTKDWTWVLERTCPECGFDTRTVTGMEVPALLLANAEVWVRVLAERSEAAVRPADDRWSVLEYACHVRDVYTRFDQRLRLIMDEDDPTFPNWDQDATATAERYRQQDPAAVATQLGHAAASLAGRFDAVPAAAWGRSGTRSDGSRFSVETLARYLLHDPVHHLYDIGEPGDGKWGDPR